MKLYEEIIAKNFLMSIGYTTEAIDEMSHEDLLMTSEVIALTLQDAIAWSNSQ